MNSFFEKMDTLLNRKKVPKNTFLIPTEHNVDLSQVSRNNRTSEELGKEEEVDDIPKKRNWKHRLIFWIVQFLSDARDYLFILYLYWYKPEAQSGSTKSRIRQLIERKYHNNKHTLLIALSFVCFMFAFFHISKIGWKYIYINEYIDTHGNSIIDPFMFDNQEYDWKVYYNRHDPELVGWVFTQRHPDPPVITPQNVTNGYFFSHVKGTNRMWNISFEMLLANFRKYAPELGSCIRADNFGIPQNIIYLTKKDDDATVEYLMIEPSMNSGDHSLEQNQVTYSMRDNLDPSINIEFTALVPRQLRAGWIVYNSGKPTTKIFYDYEAACVYRFGMNNK